MFSDGYNFHTGFSMVCTTSMQHKMFLHSQRRIYMIELSKDAKMIIASNLTVAAAIRDAAMAIIGGAQPSDSKDLVTQTFAEILTNLEKQSLGKVHER
jgi:hypothetical protein